MYRKPPKLFYDIESCVGFSDLFIIRMSGKPMSTWCAIMRMLGIKYVEIDDYDVCLELEPEQYTSKMNIELKFRTKSFSKYTYYHTKKHFKQPVTRNVPKSNNRKIKFKGMK